MKAGKLLIVGLCYAVSWGHVNPLAQAEIDQSILPAMFQTPWDPGIPGGIPADDDPIRPASVWLPEGDPYRGYSVNPSLAGTGNAAAFTAAFQAAINAAGAAATPAHRRIVRLGAGTYFVNPQIVSGRVVGIVVQVDNVTIRGEGASRTRIVANARISDLGTVILFGHRLGTSDASFALKNVTADAPRGAVVVQVADTSGYAVGDVITIDHVDGPAVDSGQAVINGEYLFFFDGQYFKRQPTYSWNGPGTGAPRFPAVGNFTSANTAARTVVPQWRSTSQETEVVAVIGNTLTIRDPLYVDFPLALRPQVWRTVPINTGAIPVGNRWSGIEHLAVAGGNNDVGFPGGGVAFSYMAYGWAKAIEVDGERISGDPAHPGKFGSSIGLSRCYRCVVRDSYVHHATDQNPGGQAYGIVLASSSNTLIENNIAVHHVKPIVLLASGGGNVVAYNYVDEAGATSTPWWQENAIDTSHTAFTHHDLIEGNWTPNLGSDTTHGNSGWHTHFRNFASGINSSRVVTQNRRAVGMDGWTHFHAYVGNVLGGGTVYQMTPFSGNYGGMPIYQLGRLPGNCGYACWDNGYALEHVYRDGNWDNVTNAVVWAGAARTLPPSLYLTSKPGFFASLAWPWVNPTAATASERVITLPAKARYDAGRPFDTTGVAPAPTAKMTGVTLMTNLASPQPTGTMITLTATGSGGATPYAFRFWVQPWGGAWQIVRDWGPSAVHAWMPTMAGGFNVAAEARGNGATVSEVQATVGFTITAGSGGGGGSGVGGPMTGVSLTTNLATPQPTGTKITLTATGSGGTTPYAYRFWVQPWGGAWQIVRDWGLEATHVWTAAAVGGHNLAVEARGAGATTVDVKSAIAFVISPGSEGGGPMTGVSLTTNLPNPQPPGTMIALTATGSGGTAPYAYRFWVQPWGGAWQIVRDWGPATYLWTAATVGGHNLAVEARSAGATAREVQSAIGFIIVPAP